MLDVTHEQIDEGCRSMERALAQVG